MKSSVLLALASVLPRALCSPVAAQDATNILALPTQSVQPAQTSEPLPPPKSLGAWSPAQQRPPDAVTRAGCTTTLSAAQATDPCAWDGTETVYASTTTVFSPVDCHGCGAVVVQSPLFACPVQLISMVETAPTPSTSSTVVCEFSGVRPLLARPLESGVDNNGY